MIKNEGICYSCSSNCTDEACLKCEIQQHKAKIEAYKSAIEKAEKYLLSVEKTLNKDMVFEIVAGTNNDSDLIKTRLMLSNVLIDKEDEPLKDRYKVTST